MKIQRFKLIDCEFMLNMKKEEQELLFFVIGEREENFIYPLLSRHFGRRIFQILFIYDLKGISLYKTYTKLLPILKLGSHVFANYFPGTLHQIIAVNAGEALRGCVEKA